MVRVDLRKFEPRLGEVKDSAIRYENLKEKCFRESQYKGPEVGTCLMHIRNSKEINETGDSLA